MKAIHSVIATLALACVFPAAATAETGDPEIIIYRISGINANGGTTEISCTPFSGVSENIRFVTRDTNAVLVDNSVSTVPHNNTKLFQSSAPSVGTAAVAATTNQIVCSAGILGGIQLHLIRFNPVSGAQE